MSFGTFLYNLLIGPLELFFEVVYSVANRHIQNPGLSIIVLSLAMNFLVLPLYKRADAVQAAQREQEQKLAGWVAHIKKTFKGDERFMILQTYYRQNNYKPYYSLRGSVSLLLEIPFFIAAYNFLSGLELLNGVSFGPIADLGQPDGLLKIGGVAINVLPILMTAINFVSGAIYTKGMSKSSKIQLYGMALIFLVFLYQSPSGLVFYWTLNNVFSVLKNIVMAVAAKVKKGRSSLDKPAEEKPVRELLPRLARGHKALFFSCTIFLTLLLGVLIPSAVIASSPAEFVSRAVYENPIRYLLYSATMAAGFFLIWFTVFHYLASENGKIVMAVVVLCLSVIFLIDYLFYGTEYGVLTSSLTYEEAPDFLSEPRLMNLLVLLAVAAAVAFLTIRWPRLTSTVALAGVLATAVLCVSNVVKIQGQQAEIKASIEQMNEAESENISIPLSKKGKNVIVLMLDRAIGPLVPYLMEERPELKEQFKGFTYYTNTMSFGGLTNIASPALFGGYEYVPAELERKSDLSLEEKQNQALKIMPYNFLETGYTVTVCDPPYAGYSWIPDLSIFDDMEGVRAFNTEGAFTLSDSSSARAKLERDFFCYSLFRVAPLYLQGPLYNLGVYNNSESRIATVGSLLADDITGGTVEADGYNVGGGYTDAFINSYLVLDNLINMTDIQDSDENTFMMMDNNTTHEPALLQEPDYTPAETVDDREYNEAHADRFTLDGETINVTTSYQMQHYHVNMAAFLKLGVWFDYLRAQGVYDNTRIIIVSDHSRNLSMFDDPDQTPIRVDTETFMPVLMVKDFGATEFTTDDTFMTNADVSLLAFDGLVENPVNPFTGNAITDEAKYTEPLYVFVTTHWEINKNNGNTFRQDDSSWYLVTGDFRSCLNWKAVKNPALADGE